MSDTKACRKEIRLLRRRARSIMQRLAYPKDVDPANVPIELREEMLAVVEATNELIYRLARAERTASDLLKTVEQ